MAGTDLAGSSNVLVVGDTSAESVITTTSRVAGERAEESHQLLVMTFNRTPLEWLSEYESVADGLPERVGVVGIGDRSQADAFETEYGDHAAEVEIVADPADLPRLGITLSEFIARWDEDIPIVLAFDSLTAFLQYADLQSVYRFLQTLKGRLDSAHGTGLYFIDPAAHDDQTMATIRPLFDEVHEQAADPPLESTE
jgi:hypothetical protein